MGVSDLRGIDYGMPIASAQVKSALLLAGLYARQDLCYRAGTDARSPEHVGAFGYPVERNGGTLCETGGGRLTATSVDAGGYFGGVFMVGAALRPAGSHARARRRQPTRTGAIDILAMGANIELINQREAGGEPVADIRVRHAELKGIEIPIGLVPLAIDEFPVLFVAAANARGVTVLRGADELRVKESDRIQVMADGLQALGIAAEPAADGMRVTGGRYGGGVVASHGDHRVAMAMAVLAQFADGPVTLRDVACVATSYPGFWDDLKALGGHVETHHSH